MIITDQILQKLQQPISDEAYCGTYIKQDRQAFRALRNVYNEANSAARKLIQTPDESELDELEEVNQQAHKKLAQLLIDCFQNTTKDIELLAWLMVTQVYLDKSLEGFQRSVALLKFLVTEHWDTVNPVLPATNLRATDESGQSKEIAECKILAFNQMIGTGDNDSILYAPLSQIPLIDNLTFFKYQSAERKGECVKLKQELQKYVVANKPQLQKLITTLKACKSDFTEIYKYLNTICMQVNVAVPNFSFIINHLDMMLKVIAFVTDLSIEDKVAEVATPSEDTSHAETTVVSPNNEVSSTVVQTTVVKSNAVGIVSNQQSFNLLAQNNLVTREQVFQELQNIADYLKVSEPHSPVAYLIEKAIRWGHMSLPELMTELMNEQQDVKQRIFTVAGLNNGEEETASTTSVASNTAKVKNNSSNNNNNATSAINW